MCPRTRCERSAVEITPLNVVCRVAQTLYEVRPAVRIFVENFVAEKVLHMPPDRAPFVFIIEEGVIVFGPSAEDRQLALLGFFSHGRFSLVDVDVIIAPIAPIPCAAR